MPELPEVETVRTTLAPLVGTRIASAWDSGKGLHMGRKPPRKKLAALVGATITELRRHGKYLLLDTDRPQSLLVHLGMTGRCLIVAANTPRAKHTHLVLAIGGGKELRFVDARRFGQIDVVDRAKEHEHEALAVLGPDPLVDGIDPALLFARSRKKKITLKAFVLDQSVIAGVGNIYASEALWRAQLRPSWRAKRLTAEAAKTLAAAIREVFDIALSNHGTTLSDFVNAEGTEGNNAEYLWVYGRDGQPCRRCKTKIRRAVHQGRATYYCPTCQPP